MKRGLFLSSLLTLLPVSAFAQSDFLMAGKNFKDVVYYVIGLLNILNPILISLAFIVFFWSLSKFILNSSKPDEIKNGKNYMMWSILILFILLTYRTVIGLVANDLEVRRDGGKIPQASSVLLPVK